jgi:hypothetical protein
MKAMSAPPKVAPGEELHPTWVDVLGCLWTGGSSLGMAVIFYLAWWHPYDLDDGRWVKLGVGVMVMEFILVHSGGLFHHFMESGLGWGRLKTVLGLTALYSVLGVGIAMGFKSWWLFGSYAVVMSGRLWALFAGHWTEMDQAISQRRMVSSVLLYLGLIFATLFLPVPRGGLTPALIDSVRSGSSGGEWISHPEKALAMGTAYFLLLGLIEIRPPRRRLKVPVRR